MKKENLNGKKDSKIKKFKTESCHKKFLLQVNSLLNLTSSNKGDLMNYKKVKNV